MSASALPRRQTGEIDEADEADDALPVPALPVPALPDPPFWPCPGPAPSRPRPGPAPPAVLATGVATPSDAG